jgi:hypothetical protein
VRDHERWGGNRIRAIGPAWALSPY